jgi:hypothetical protein
MALDARVHIAGPNGRRAVDLSSFFTGYRKTSLKAGELLTTIEIPKPWPQMVRFYKCRSGGSTTSVPSRRLLDGLGQWWSRAARALRLWWCRSDTAARHRRGGRRLGAGME